MIFSKDSLPRTAGVMWAMTREYFPSDAGSAVSQSVTENRALETDDL